MKKNTWIMALSISGSLLFAGCGGETEKPDTTEKADSSKKETTEVTEAPVDLGASTVKWNGEMLGIKAHYGTVDLKEASLKMQGDKVVGGSFVIDMTTINPQDDMYTEEQTPEKLVGHLSSDDFFAVKEHPTASFEITGAGEEGVTGNLTIRGNTNEEMVKNVSVQDGKVTGDLTFDRKKYDVSWEAPMPDAVLSNDIELNIELVLNK